MNERDITAIREALDIAARYAGPIAGSPQRFNIYDAENSNDAAAAESALNTINRIVNGNPRSL